jgi:ribosomal subunit interface protein
MHIDISGQNIELTESLHDRVHAEFSKLEKVLDEHSRITIEIGKTSNHHKQGDIYKAEGKIIEPKAEYFAEIITGDLYSSIDALSDELFEQVTQSKSRHRALLKKGQSVIKKLLRLS